MSQTSKNPTVIRNALVILCLFALFLPGCEKRQANVQWAYSIKDIDGNATVTTEMFTFMLEGVSAGAASTSSIMVSGRGLAGGRMQSPLGKEGFVWSDSYDGKGVCSITFGPAKMKIIDHGKTLVVGDRRFRLGKEKLALLFQEDGTFAKTELTAANLHPTN